jgi:hypothetical protein
MVTDDTVDVEVRADVEVRPLVEVNKTVAGTDMVESVLKSLVAGDIDVVDE